MTVTEEIRELVRQDAGRDREFAARLERLCTLLEQYQDVLSGIQDGDVSFVGPGDGLALMCESWNSPAYRQLENLRIALAAEAPALYWQLAEVYFRSRRKLVAVCPRCRRETVPRPTRYRDSTTLDYGTCKHGSERSKLEIRAVRIVSEGVQPAMVALAIRWLEERWAGGVFVPEEVQAIVERRAVKASRRKVAIR